LEVNCGHFFLLGLISLSVEGGNKEVSDLGESGWGSIDSDLNVCLVEVNFNFTCDSENFWDDSSSGEVCVGS